MQSSLKDPRHKITSKVLVKVLKISFDYVMVLN